MENKLDTDESESYKYVFVNFVSGIWHHDGGLDPHGFPDALPHQFALVQGLGNGLEACYIDFRIIFTVISPEIALIFPINPI